MDHTVDLTPTPGFKCYLPTANRCGSMAGTLAWVANWTRPELAFSVHKLQRTQSNPEPKHFEAAERAFQYLKGTQSECLCLGGDLVLRAFTDADFCSDRTDGKTVSGYVRLLGDAPIVWASRLQGADTTSTVEAEYLALRSAVKKISCGLGIYLQTWDVPSMTPRLLLRIKVAVSSEPMILLFPRRTGTFMSLITFLRSR